MEDAVDAGDAVVETPEEIPPKDVPVIPEEAPEEVTVWLREAEEEEATR